jgi:hypothetical protein
MALEGVSFGNAQTTANVPLDEPESNGGGSVATTSPGAAADDGFTNSNPFLPDNLQKSILLANAGDPPATSSATPTSFTLARSQAPTYTAGAGSNTQTTYRTGAPQRPNMQHDNGFLQNPNNPSDPKPIATQSPSWDDRKAYFAAVAKADAALAAVDLRVPKWMTPDQFDKYLDLPDGIRAYHHFLTGNGADRNFSYDKFVNDDAAGKTILNNAIGDTQRGAEAIYGQMLAADPSLANKPVTFKITGGQIGVGGGNSQFPYPQTENWQKAIGAHQIWNSATVTVTPGKNGAPPTFKMDYTLHAEDRYNFNPGAADIATGTPDAVNGRFETVGLAHQYMNYGSLSRDVSWTPGQVNRTTNVTGGPR